MHGGKSKDDKFLGRVRCEPKQGYERLHQESKPPRSGHLEHAHLPSRGAWDSPSDTGQPDE